MSSEIMTSIKIPVVLITVLGFFLIHDLALAVASNYAGKEKASESVMVVGKVFCDTCLEHKLSENGYVISGASIAVECGLNRKAMSVSVTGETDENGDFKVEIPSNILQLADGLNKCRVRPRSSPYDSCRIPSTSAPSKLTLQSDSNGVLTYSAGSFSYRHETVPPSCYRKDLLSIIRGRSMAEDVYQASKAGQQTPTIPSLPKFPPATLPSAPPLPKFSIPPLPTVPSLPKISPLPQFSVPPLPKISPLPQFSVPPLPKISPFPQASVPPLPKISPFPQASVPPLPKISPLPQFGVPPLPKISPLPQFSVPPLPKISPLPQLSFPPFPKSTVPGSPPLPQIPNSQFPPIPFLTPPPPTKKPSP